MQTIQFKVDDSYLNIVMTLLSNLKKDIVKELRVEKDKTNTKINSEQELDFSEFKIEAFKNIDGLEYQKKIRDEW